MSGHFADQNPRHFRTASSEACPGPGSPRAHSSASESPGECGQDRGSGAHGWHRWPEGCSCAWAMRWRRAFRVMTWLLSLGLVVPLATVAWRLPGRARARAFPSPEGGGPVDPGIMDSSAVGTERAHVGASRATSLADHPPLHPDDGHAESTDGRSNASQVQAYRQCGSHMVTASGRGWRTADTCL